MTPTQAEAYTPRQLVELARESLTTRVNLHEVFYGKASHEDIQSHAWVVASYFPYIVIDPAAKDEGWTYEGPWLYYNEANISYDHNGKWVGTPHQENGWTA